MWQLAAAKNATFWRLRRRLPSLAIFGGLWETASILPPRSLHWFQGRHNSGSGRYLDCFGNHWSGRHVWPAPLRILPQGKHLPTMRGFVFNSHAQTPTMDWLAPTKTSLEIAFRLFSSTSWNPRGCYGDDKGWLAVLSGRSDFLRRMAGNENGISVF